MSLNTSFRSVIPVANDDTSTYFVSLQPVTCGKTDAKFVSANLTFQPSTQTLSVNKSPVVYSNTRSIFNLTTQPTPPTNPGVGDLWYDTSTDIQFEYVFDGVNYQWVDVTSPVIPGKVEFVYKSAIALANANIVYAQADTVNNYSNIVQITVNTTNYTDGTTIYWRDIGTANNITRQFPRFLDNANSGNATIYNNTNTVTRIAIDDSSKFKNINTYLQLGFYSCASFNNLLTVSNSVSMIDNSYNYTIEYLIVGGGGGGGTNGGGGGGAGGVLTGAVCVDSRTANATMNVIVGVGGSGKPAGPACANFNSTAGGNSAFIGSGTLAPINLVAIGGGYGGNFLNCNPGKPGGFGGSGGGGAGWNTNGVTITNFGLGQPGQGFPGGQLVTGTCGSSGGGGGGAGGTGTGMPPTPNFGGGAGGVGYTWPLNGVSYGGGGGGGASRQPAQTSAVGGNSPTSVFGLGGAPFGGGVGGGSRVLPAPLIPTNPVNGTPGTDYRGGGGGGSAIAPSPLINAAASGNGGKGVVILAIPNGYYTPEMSAGANSTSTSTCGSKTLLTYLANNTFYGTRAGYTAQFLAVGGGGGGGGGNVNAGGGGGGGAGGLISGQVKLWPGTTYTISVGTGGYGGNGANTPGDGSSSSVGLSGNNSTISVLGTTIYTALGGGGGGALTKPGINITPTVRSVTAPELSGVGGGSGGGGISWNDCTLRYKYGAGGIATGSPGVGVAGTQGYPGAPGAQIGYGPSFAIDYGAGGGGGAGGKANTYADYGAITECYNFPVNWSAGLPGGVGYTWPITELTYAGGGGGAAGLFYSTAGMPTVPGPTFPTALGQFAGGNWPNPGPNSFGVGGAPGGGGLGARTGVKRCGLAQYGGGPFQGTPGTHGRGGGGGGSSAAPTNGVCSGPSAPIAASTSFVGGSGGPGTVIFAIPTPNYPGTAPGATVTTPPAAPGMTVLTYVGSFGSPNTFTYIA